MTSNSSVERAFSLLTNMLFGDAASSKSALQVTFNFIQNLGGGGGGGDIETPPVLKRVT